MEISGMIQKNTPTFFLSGCKNLPHKLDTYRTMATQDMQEEMNRWSKIRPVTLQSTMAEAKNANLEPFLGLNRSISALDKSPLLKSLRRERKKLSGTEKFFCKVSMSNDTFIRLPRRIEKKNLQYVLLFFGGQTFGSYGCWGEEKKEGQNDVRTCSFNTTNHAY